MKRRIEKFFRALREHPELYFQSPFKWHNIRAAWIQTDLNWLYKRRVLVDDDEAEAFIKALEEI